MSYFICKMLVFAGLYSPIWTVGDQFVYCPAGPHDCTNVKVVEVVDKHHYRLESSWYWRHSPKRRPICSVDAQWNRTNLLSFLELL